MVQQIAADEPQTEREWLQLISRDVKTLSEKVESVCDKQKTNQQEIDELKTQRLIQNILSILLIALITGRYVFGPTSIPIVP